jgi:hypothetical protein
MKLLPVSLRHHRCFGTRLVHLGFVAAITVLGSRTAAAVDKVVVKRDGVRIHLEGRVIVEAQDGGVLLLDRQGKLWTAQPDEIVERAQDEFPFEPFDAEQLGKALQDELPAGFQVHSTAHYLICYNTSTAYAVWCGALFERLYRAFTNFWDRRGLELREPPMPLVAVVFADKESYARYATNEIGETAKSIIGYYHLITNRVIMYDLTGVQKIQQPGDRRRNTAEINRMLSRPEAGSLVATIIHEATHQIAFNCGLQTRLADIPVWLSEGIAMYFETPDLGSSQGWRGIGALNRNRLYQFRKYARQRPNDSLDALLLSDRRIQGRSEDKRYQDDQAVINAYAEAWCLTYYLIKHKPEEFVAYLKVLAAKGPVVEDTPGERREQFEKHFGELSTFDAQFLRQISRLR